jgi:dihydrolipoamide dehydrogenase
MDTNMKTLDTDVAIIGSGTAALNALREVEKAGGSWLLIESGPYGTMCARTGCMPSKTVLTS